MSEPAIDVRSLGDSGLRVGCVGLGTYRVFNVKGDASEARCDAVVDSALSAGCNLFDTSPMYGSAERVLATTLEDRREEAVVAAKVWARDRATAGEQIKQTLAWFDHIDVYQVHNLLGLDEHLPALRELKATGRIRAIGVSHYLPSAEDDLKRLIRDRVVDVIQVPYHPHDRWNRARNSR